MYNIETLADIIRFHNEQYFNEGATETPSQHDRDAITDAEYDALVAQMKMLDPNHPVLAEVGADPTYGKKITHPEIMGSLSKATYGEEDDDISELLNWRKNVVGDCDSIICMPKIVCDIRYIRYNDINSLCISYLQFQFCYVMSILITPILM